MNKSNAVLIIAFLVFAPLVFLNPTAHATVVVVQSASGMCNNVVGHIAGPIFIYTCNVPFSSSPTINDTIAIVAAVYNDTTSSSGVTESYTTGNFYLGSSTILLGTGGGGAMPDGFYKFAFFGDVVIDGSNLSDLIGGNVNVALNVSGANNSEAENFAVYEVELANVNASNITGGDAQGSTNAYPNNGGFTLLDNTSSTFALSMVVPQSHHTATVNATFSHTNLNGLNSVTTAQYHLFGASATPSTIFDMNGVTGSVPWIWSGIILGEAVPPSPGPSTVIQLTKVVACTFYELQCWLYPMFFFGVYMVMVLGLAWWGDVSTSDYTGLMLEALAIGSLVAVIMGMINIMFPLLFTVAQIIRALRF